MPKKPLALVMGITGDMGFAAGCVLQALRRHSPGLNVDILIYSDGALPESDALLLENLGARILPFTPVDAGFRQKYIALFSLLALAKLECFLLLREYRAVIWLDADIAVQGDIRDLAAFGPFAIALEDPCFSPTGKTMTAAINVAKPLPGLDMDAPNLNTGVIVFQDTIPDPESFYHESLAWLREHAEHIKYMDQPVLNKVAQELQARGLFQLLPHDRFNAHPRNPAAQYAAIVHAFGTYKLWDDGMLRCAFPEWDRDYRRWLAIGGSPAAGTIDNAEFLEGGAFFMFTRLYGLMTAAENALAGIQDELGRERALRQRLEAVVRKINGD